ncbi:protein phosphatase 1B [Anopheles merus]|uniref:protein phosphatase 1B n=1 Tax=Anopheles merus TaxID=30066 RepID=UPI001BE492AB|nr:protein phosphatase 1B [Anopheles merus]XP_041775032.1 protein phosphatase 1B [Anopheles merus]XP_041775033.1 protein phosphatase 1B [Anopheles merus]
MGAFLEKPMTSKHNEHGEGNGLRYGVGSMQGWRCEMEDAYHAKTGLGDSLDDWNYFAVFDGHAGDNVAKHCAANLLQRIITTTEFGNNDITKGIHTGFLQLDESMRNIPELASGLDKSGTTAVCAFISSQHLYIANCGDSRAVLCQNAQPIFTTQDHKPILPGEKERIQNAGGSVMVQRVNGSLAVSRALGDYDYKKVANLGQCEQLVSPEPEIFCRDREPADEFLVLACDGVWDVMSNEELCQFVHNRLEVSDNLVDVANQVIDTCLHKGSRDNMSIIIIAFPGAPPVSEEAQKREEALEQHLRARIEQILGEMSSIEYGALLKELAREDIPDLPPGGGLHAKCSYVSKVFKELHPKLAETCEMGNY